VLHTEGIEFSPWGIAIVKAVVLAKFMLLGEAMKIGERTTLMSADSRCRRVNSRLSCTRRFRAHPGKAGGAVVEATVDHTLMRGLEPHDR
jgi:hypothetical protein